MITIDVGHCYALDHLDGQGDVELRFVKREGRKYPGNVGHYPGTNLQEVLRACIDRVKYLDHQVQCRENLQIIYNLRDCLRLLEERAAQRHGRPADPRLYGLGTNDPIEWLPTCPKCGHIGCKEVE